MTAMILQNDYYVIWMVYLAASVAGLLIVWRIGSWFTNKEVRRVLVLCTVAVVWTPYPLSDHSGYWAPAFMAMLLEAISNGVESAIQRAIPILLVMLGLVLCSAAWRMFADKTQWRQWFARSR